MKLLVALAGQVREKLLEHGKGGIGGPVPSDATSVSLQRFHLSFQGNAYIG